MKYKQRCGKLQKALATEIGVKQKYQKWWREAEDKNAILHSTVFDLDAKVKRLENDKLKLELEMLKEIVGLYKRIKDPFHEDTVSPQVDTGSPQVDDRYNVTSSSVITPNITTSSTTSLTNGFRS